MTQSSFYFHLLRISIAQLLKTHGFDKCSDRALDVVTDLYLRHLELSLKAVKKNTEIRSDDEPNLQDAANALIELKIISPAKRLDAHDIDKLTLKGLENFENWFQSDLNSRLRETARPNLELIQSRINAKKLKDTNNKMNSLTAALGQSQLPVSSGPQQVSAPSHSTPSHMTPSFPSLQRQQTQSGLSLHSSLTAPLDSTKVPPSNNETGEQEAEDLTVDEDWIKFVIRQQVNEKPELKFKGTVMVDYLPKDKRPVKRKKPNHDFLIVGPTPESLIDHLPYIRSDDEDDSDTDYDDVVSIDEDGNELVSDRKRQRVDNVDDNNGSHYEGDAHQGENGENGVYNDNQSMGHHHDSIVLDDYDYYAHDDLYEGDVDLYGDHSGNNNNLNLFG